jgi:gamma-glutamylputrescine oxidase
VGRSYWEDIGYLRSPDCLIVGAGLVGMFTALNLKELNPSLDVLVVERGPFSQGASTKNAGFACFGSASELLEDVRIYGKDKVVETVRMRYEGLKLSRQLFSDEAIEFDPCGGMDVFSSENNGIFDDCADHLDEINDLVFQATGLKSVFEVSSGNPPGCHGFENYIVNKAEGSINTALLNQKLYDLCVSKKVRFLFGVHVLKLNVEQKYAECETIGKIYAQKILLTINGFIPHLLPIKDVNAVRNQVIVTEKIQGLSLKGCYHMDRGYVYFRQVDQRILIGGGRNVLGVSEVTDQLDTTPEAIRFLKNIITKHILLDRIPAIEFHWSGILGVGSDKKPIIQEVHQDIFVGVRMGGMVVAISSIVGKQLAELTLGMA